jgi:hypothetical protein
VLILFNVDWGLFLRIRHSSESAVRL